MKNPDTSDCVCTSGDSASLSPNRAFVVETFFMLISQKQTPVSSDAWATGATFWGFLFIPPCFLSSLVFFFSFSLSASCSANSLINRSANTAPLKTFFPSWVALMHHARSTAGTSAWLTVIYLLHSESRQPYQRLWETFRNLLLLTSLFLSILPF